jgi:hypothetical protein
MSAVQSDAVSIFANFTVFKWEAQSHVRQAPERRRLPELATG